MKHFNSKNTKIVFKTNKKCELFVNNKLITKIKLDNDYNLVDMWDSFMFEGEVFDIHFCADYGTIKNGFDVPSIVIYELECDEIKSFSTNSDNTDTFMGIENVSFMFEPKKLKDIANPFNCWK